MKITLQCLWFCRGSHFGWIEKQLQTGECPLPLHLNFEPTKSISYSVECRWVLQLSSRWPSLALKRERICPKFHTRAHWTFSFSFLSLLFSRPFCNSRSSITSPNMDLANAISTFWKTPRPSLGLMMKMQLSCSKLHQAISAAWSKSTRLTSTAWFRYQEWKSNLTMKLKLLGRSGGSENSCRNTSSACLTPKSLKTLKTPWVNQSVNQLETVSIHSSQPHQHLLKIHQNADDIQTWSKAEVSEEISIQFLKLINFLESPFRCYFLR